MQSALQMALRDITTLPKSRSGGEESDGSEVCLALLIVSFPPPSSTAPRTCSERGPFVENMNNGEE